MKKKWVKIFVAYLLFFIMCSSFINVSAGQADINNKNDYTLEHNNEDYINEGEATEEEESTEKDKEEILEETEEENIDETVPEKETDKEENKNEENKEQSEEENKSENTEKEESLNKEEQKEEREVYKNPTTDTFETVVGPYTLKNILSKYNVFSFGDITASHIMGPIVGREVHRVHDKSTTAISDYANNVPSYLEKIYKAESGNGNNVGLNYWYDRNRPGVAIDKVKIPNFYIGEKDNFVEKVGNPATYKMVYGNEKISGPNDSGNKPVLQNDNFLDFEKAAKITLEESKKLLNDPKNIIIDTSEKYKIDEKGTLKIDAGNNYLIKDASRLKKVNIIYPEGFSPINKPLYPYGTIINVEGNLAKGILEGKEQSLFPNIYVNGGDDLDNEQGFSGINGDFGYGQFGEFVKVIWNMPNIVTTDGENRIWKKSGSDILGHIVAPQAEFWNCNEVGGKIQWAGGNINGGAIVKSWYGGSMESHYWPHEGEIGEVKPGEVSLFLKGKKIFNKGSLEEKFKFKLSYEGGSLPEGVSNINIPQEVYQEADGTIKFKEIKFTKPGEYNFIIEEIPNEGNKDIIYDKTKYRIVVTVKEGEKGILSLETKIINLSDNKVVEDIVFINERILDFTIEKRDEDSNQLLEGAIFDLYEGNLEGKPQGNPIIKDIKTDESGKVKVSSKILEYNKLYVLVETKAPDDYIIGENILFYIKGDTRPYPDKGIEIKNHHIIGVNNKKKSDVILPETGGSGNRVNIVLGLGFMISSILIFGIKGVKRG
ncbi:FctA domain-containing protein [uncultured Clostridium sp.]|uniref:Spy0128 family protein n=1 Tax=uncultured Clostridium sp. TaxID=59620 RepID=UPI0026127741|nr:FctA domain-containing protein [uncultured Clostridium sp.]